MNIPRGIIPALVTPFTYDAYLDEEALRKLTNHMIHAGCHGLFLTGSQGEFWALNSEEKERVWEIVREETNGQLPVYAGVSSITTQEGIELARSAEKVGVDAITVLTPFFITPSDDELFSHFRAIAEAISLPVLLYSNPARTGVGLSPNLVRRLSEVENIMGLKDSSGDLELFIEYISVVPESYSILMGRDTLIYSGLLLGARGAVAATANVFPELVVKIYEDFISGDLQGSRQAQELLAPLRRAFNWGTFPVVIKEALAILGMDSGPTRFPVGPLSGVKRMELKDLLGEMEANIAGIKKKVV